MKARILIVEDESIVQLDLETRLRKLGHSVVGFASSGEEAVAKAVNLAPDLILMDVRLEGPVDGVEAARRIRAQRQIPIIFVTAFADSMEQQESQKPLQPSLSKPFATPELRAAIAQSLGER